MGLQTPVATPSRSEINPPVVEGSQPADEFPETPADGSKPAEKVPETSPPQSVNAAQDAAQKPVGDASADKEQVTSDPEQTRKALGIVFVMSCVHGHVL